MCACLQEPQPRPPGLQEHGEIGDLHHPVVVNAFAMQEAPALGLGSCGARDPASSHEEHLAPWREC